MTTVNAELQTRMEALEAERMRPERQDLRTEPTWADDFRVLLLILARLLERPGPPDPAPAFLETLRFGSASPTCLIEAAVKENPQWTLCGINLFADSTRGWSIRGRYTSPAWTCAPCPGCVEAARTGFAGLPVVGVLPLSGPFAEALGVKALDRPQLVDSAVEEIAP